MNQSTLDDYSSTDHECPKCDRRFTTRSGLGRHFSASHGERLEEYERRQGEHECPSCEAAFATIQGMKTHHSQVHGESIAGIKRLCDWCGGTFRRQESSLTEDNCFCDETCHGEYRSVHYSGENHPTYKGKVTVECAYCGTPKSVNPARAEHTGRFYCDPVCKGEWQSENLHGQNHPTHQGGRSAYHEIVTNLPGASWQKVAERNRAAANNECQLCGAVQKEDERAFPVHHIVPVFSGGVNEDELLMVLCQSCHNKAESFIRQYPEFDPVLVE